MKFMSEKKRESAAPAANNEGGEKCPIYKKCNGCQLQNMSYDRQLEWKQGKVEQLLKKFGHVERIIGMDSPCHYRNKVQAAFGVNRGGRFISGIYQSATHTIIPTDSCMTEDQTADEIIVTIRTIMKSFKLFPYDFHTGKGQLRHVLVRRGFTSGQVMVVLVLTTPIFSAAKHFVKELTTRHPEITTVLLNVNSGYEGLMLGGNEKVLYGPGFIEDTLCGCRFRISSRSFYQINPVQTEILYGKAMEYAGLTGKETVLDAYCGIGTIGLIAARSAAAVVGVELNRDAVKDAIANARLNEIKNAYFQQGDAGHYLKAMAAEGKAADVVFMDPPRSGSDKEFLAALTDMMPQKIVYISCNPETQARDLGWLTQKGYRVVKIQPVDLFPHTNHVECVVSLARI